MTGEPQDRGHRSFPSRRRAFRGNATGPSAPDGLERDAALTSRLDALEASLRHLEAALEGLQDAVHRRAQLDDRRNDELRRRADAGGSAGPDPGGEARERWL